jgi:hypothetical protein
VGRLLHTLLRFAQSGTPAVETRPRTSKAAAA